MIVGDNYKIVFYFSTSDQNQLSYAKADGYSDLPDFTTIVGKADGDFTLE